ncbi:MAG: PaaI family thioesterase [Candidatus Limnocylindrales bacterium]
MSDEACVQERYAPASVCYGCGPANERGLHIRSFPDPDRADGLVAQWTPAPFHHAFDGVLNGGVVGTLLDCHANWAAALAIMRANGDERPPATVTADYAVRMLAPTPMDVPLTLHSWPVEVAGRRATSEARIETPDGTVTATLRGHFVAVREGHPAHERWRSS